MLDEDVWSHCWLKSFFYNKIGSTVMYYTYFTTICDNYYQVLLIITHVWNMINIHMYLEFALCLFPKIAPHASSTNNLFIIKLCIVKNVDILEGSMIFTLNYWTMLCTKLEWEKPTNKQITDNITCVFITYIYHHRKVCLCEVCWFIRIEQLEIIPN